MAVTLTASSVLFAGGARAQDISDAGLVYWGVQLEQLEYRFGENDVEVLAYDGDAFVGTDELKLRWQGEGEYELDEEVLETFENQLAVQIPVTPFFDAKAGIRYDTPEGPDRFYGVVGVHGLAPQWFEVDVDAFLSEEGDVSFRLDAEYEGLITNRLILTPSVEIDVGLSHDREIGLGAGLRSAEIGARLSYDLIDRAVSPYVGVHYEQLFGGTKNLAEAEGEDGSAFFVVAGVRLQF